MTEEHPDKRILVLDHPQLEAVASSDIQLGEHTQEGGDTGENQYRELTHGPNFIFILVWIHRR